MRKPIIAGNWKMNGNKSSIDDLINGISQYKAAHAEMIVFPPYVYLDQVEKMLTGTDITWGAQNLCVEPEGAFTGEVSASMLLDVGCQYVLVGHSERRSLYSETDQVVAAKFARAVQTGLSPVLCVGEQLVEREKGLTENVIGRQIKAVLDLPTGVNAFEKAIIAYEPVWAIGTGVTASPEEAQAVHASIRAQLSEHDKEIANAVRILYGGSVKPDNAGQLFAMADIDGALVGGASLQALSFLEIARLCKR